ncbi:MAG: hypothetical protein ACOYOO_16185, partial [Saprospiraceae bacterium]
MPLHLLRWDAAAATNLTPNYWVCPRDRFFLPYPEKKHHFSYLFTGSVPGFAAKDFIWWDCVKRLGLCKKVFAAFGGRIFFG